LRSLFLSTGRSLKLLGKDVASFRFDGQTGNARAVIFGSFLDHLY